LNTGLLSFAEEFYGMNELGSRIKFARKSKGFSQEKLSEDAQINLRTLQRIEKGETNPHGDTLLRLANALDIPLENLIDYGLEENTAYIRIMHFSALIFLVFPMGNIVLPLILWLIKKDKIKNLSYFAKRLMNFQICWTIILYLPILWITINRLLPLDLQPPGYGFIKPWTFLVFYFGFFYLLNIIYLLIVGLRISENPRNYFPIAIRFIK
jgi:transcriptional regulator with XRE-family HTH domain